MSDTELQALQKRYRALQEKVSELGYVTPGSVIERETVCGTPSCHCHDDPPVRHGPYFQYSRKVAGKTLTRRLDANQATQYREWIANRRQLEKILDQMDQISRQAADIITTQQHPGQQQQPPSQKPRQIKP